MVKSSAMLRKIQLKKNQPHGGSFAIVASRYNARFVDAMLRAAKAELWRADVSSIQIVRVPGAYEIPNGLTLCLPCHNKAEGRFS